MIVIYIYINVHIIFKTTCNNFTLEDSAPALWP